MAKLNIADTKRNIVIQRTHLTYLMVELPFEFASCKFIFYDVVQGISDKITSLHLKSTMKPQAKAIRSLKTNVYIWYIIIHTYT